MNRNAIEGTEATLCDACWTIPLSVLSLDLDTPVGGWEQTLLTRGIELTEDDLGRPAVLRSDAQTLMAERRQWERTNAEQAAARAEQTARESRPVLRGIPRPPGADPNLSAYEVLRGADADAEQSDPRRRLSPQEEFLRERLGPPQKVESE